SAESLLWILERLVKHALQGPPANGKSRDLDHATEMNASDTTPTAPSSPKEVIPDKGVP
ncbi:hypothetical protein P7K49_026385, partial [Saguinus oedipus]